MSDVLEPGALRRFTECARSLAAVTADESLRRTATEAAEAMSAAASLLEEFMAALPTTAIIEGLERELARERT
jgi:hypothetical protein